MNLTTVQGLSAVPGYRSYGVHAGIKKERPDVGIIVSDMPNTQVAGVFTQNAFAAAPVHISRQHVADGCAQAIVINSGNANACTGRQGLRDALSMTQLVADGLGIENEQVLVCSTGIIGRPLPMAKIQDGIQRCLQGLDVATGAEISQAILTTDTGPKEATVQFEANDMTYTLSGIAKGAGMIHPNMGTMLAFMVTDAPVPGVALRRALMTATTTTFNQISIDGDESTNDTAILMANGASGGASITPGHPDWQNFQDAVTSCAKKLAKQIAADGEGATRLFEVTIQSAPDDVIARKAARAVCKSNLVKSAVHGRDPNWGRIIAAMGSTGMQVGSVSIDIIGNGDTVRVLDDTTPTGNEKAASRCLSDDTVRLIIDVNNGDGKGTAWGCDLTPDYVHFNAEYRT